MNTPAFVFLDMDGPSDQLAGKSLRVQDALKEILSGFHGCLAAVELMRAVIAVIAIGATATVGAFRRMRATGTA